MREFCIVSSCVLSWAAVSECCLAKERGVARGSDKATGTKG